MKKILILLILVVSIAGCSNMQEKKISEKEEKLISDIAKKLGDANFTTSGAVKIAVLDFKNSKNQSTDLENFITDELTSELFENKKFEVIERNDLDEVFEEQKLSEIGMVEDVSKAGNLSGVDVLCIGSTKEIGDKIQISAKLISVSTGKLLSFADGTIGKRELQGKIGNTKRPIKIVKRRKLRTVIIK